jgi:hypothetical protein
MAGRERDPVSAQFDAAAAKLLARAARRPGTWAGTYVRNPSPQWVIWGRRNGIRLLGPDNAPGGLARTRWCRGFVRSVYYLHKWHWYESGGYRPADRRNVPNHSTGIQFQVGTVRIGKGGAVLGRAVRIRFRTGGDDALEAVRKLPDSRRIYDDAGNPAGRWSSPAGRDW